MGIKKTLTEILSVLPIVKNKTYKSAGVYSSETDNTKTGGTNSSDGFNMSTDPFAGNDLGTLTEGIVVNNIK
jgi:hypothetical protein